MDATKIIEFLQTYPVWFRLVVVCWIFLGALTISGFLLVSRGPASSTSQEASPPTVNDIATSRNSAPPQPISSPRKFDSISLADYASKREELGNRFVQLEKFEREVVGADVNWIGSASNVSGLHDNARDIILTLDSFGPPHEVFFARCSDDLKLTLSSLRKGDKVRVIGTLEAAGVRPWLKAQSVELL